MATLFSLRADQDCLRRMNETVIFPTNVKEIEFVTTRGEEREVVRYRIVKQIPHVMNLGDPTNPQKITAFDNTVIIKEVKS